MMTLNSGARWYVVQTRPHAETKAAEHLRRQGFDTYLPRYLKRRRHARRVETVPAPLFPRYLFVAVDIAEQRWRAIQSSIGVSHLVCSGSAPAVLPDDVAAGLKRREDADGYIKLDRRPLFAPGDKICVHDGAFSACLGLFEGVTGGDRVAILLELLGRNVRVFLNSDLVTAA